MRAGHLPISMALIVAAVSGNAAVAAESAPAKIVDTVIGCRTIGDAAQRLACFDRSVEALQSATAKRDIVVVDKEEVRKTRRSLFGYSLPDTHLFGEADNKTKSPSGPDETEITASIRSARQGADGNWVFTLDDGAVWRQTDNSIIALSPKPGNSVTIRRAALGSYFIKIGRQPGVKARREG